MNGEVFYEFVQSCVLLHLMPFNPHSVLVLDNASIHHVDCIMRMVESVRVLVLFLPPYQEYINGEYATPIRGSIRHWQKMTSGVGVG